jgi:hypothetical protein
MTIILATWEAEVGGLWYLDGPRQKHISLSEKYTKTKMTESRLQW